MAYDYKKEQKALYQPKATPSAIEVPPMNFLAVRGQGDPNQEGGAYKTAVGLLFGLAYTIKMSKKGSHPIPGYFDFVVPPLEGLWRQGDGSSFDLTRKQDFRWIALLRLPEFVTPAELDWARTEAGVKKKADFSPVELFSYDEGLCVQCMHQGPYDSEPATMAAMLDFARENGYVPDHSETRLHHELYLSDPNKCAPEKLRTILRVPVRRK